MKNSPFIKKYFGKDLLPYHKELLDERENVLFLSNLSGGAVIFNYKDVRKVRELEQQYPGFIKVNDDTESCTRVLNDTPAGSFAIPYFAAFLTDEGKHFVEKNMLPKVRMDQEGYHFHKEGANGEIIIDTYKYK